LRLCDAGNDRQCGGARGQVQECAAGKFHRVPFREILECGDRGSSQKGCQVEFFECKPADGMSAAAEKMDFGTSRWAARWLCYIDGRLDGRG
jgi:hypothetical protein